ncbi:hypothetical protein [Nitrosovibrio sp. Nv4]|uniref:hypothetical protein n=1 Tax=Nitrosovibrio sp. Nv4 TaxID=1945880 RepID=UPI000BCFEC58|nr:hypothetical protein [Nitrosovibrio sp. Nv4]SOD41823.1 hypothetical protein SAMN06298226_2130 [Nitrosovibrio sp. Nv4]
MFTKRVAHSSIIYAGERLYGVRYNDTVANGDNVALLLGTELVLVEIVQVMGGSRFRGRIHGFQLSCARAFNGMKIHDEVAFEEAHVLTCFR